MNTKFIRALILLVLMALGVSAQARQSIDYDNSPYVKVYGVSSTGKYLIYDIMPDLREADSYVSGDWLLSKRMLPYFMLFVQPSDIDQNGYLCDTLCFNEYSEVVGLNPEAYPELKGQTPTKPVSKVK